MKLRTVLMLSFAMMISCSGLIFAEDSQGAGNDSQQSPGGGRPDMGKMSPMMMQMMRKDSMVATSDGGIVVMAGPRLIKYDKDMTLVKEVEMPRGKPPAREKTDGGQENQEGNPSEQQQY